MLKLELDPEMQNRARKAAASIAGSFKWLLMTILLSL